MGIVGCVDCDGISRAAGWRLPGWRGRSTALYRKARSLGHWLAPLILLSASVTAADTVNYEYDELGRLIRVERVGANVSTYAYDDAGNRTQTAAGVTPGVPASISVPSSSSTGNYTISWGAASGTVTAYQLYEATNPGFSGQTLVHNGTATSKALSGRGNGTYYYRVAACNGPACSDYRTGGNPTTVTLPPGVPASISVPASSNTGSYTISWGSSSGNVTAYKLYEATNPGFSGQTLAYSGTGTSKAISGKGNGTYYYRVRACNGSACSAYRTGANATIVTLPPAAPATISGPFQSTGSYTISWSSSSGATRYELWESVFGGAFSKVYDGANTARSFNSKPSGEYTYKAKACNTGGCSGYSPTHLVTVCSGSCSFQAPPDDQ